ncbi:MAG: cob(I)yrinic acid a,c-diamide adenosyltransferase [Tepidisphaerales bacterium]
MKLYTRTGDDGTTGLIGGQRVSKDHIRIDAYGTVDELNATLGMAAVAVTDVTRELEPLLRAVQNELFAVGAVLATPPGSPYAASAPPIRPEWAMRLEQEIDHATGRLPPLRQFILPGGTELAARLHLARTVCRRAERLTVALHRLEPLDAVLLTYLNRLSDWLFVHARYANHLAGVPDRPWEKG